MIKFRIYPIKILTEWTNISKSLFQLSYNENSMRGIKLSNISNKHIEGTYFEKVIYSETINNPITGIETVTQETFLHTNFNIYREKKLIVLINPNRRISSLFGFLSINANNIFYIREAMFDIGEFCTISKSKLHNFRIKKVSFSPFNISNQSTAIIAVSSLNDALEESLTLGIDIPSLIQRVVFECTYQGKKVSGSISKSGLFSISNNAGYDFFDEFIKNDHLIK